MQFYLQFGYGMMGHARELLAQWRGGGGVVLSPRDLNPTQLINAAREAQQSGAVALIDPQCYIHEANHPRLRGHSHWDAMTQTTSNLLSERGASELLALVAQMNNDAATDWMIIPGFLATDVDDHWLALQSRFIEEAPKCTSRRTLATIAVGREPMRDESKIEAIVTRSEQWNVDGFYIVAEPPSSYLVDDPRWLANLLILASGLKLRGGMVVVGYCSHQSLMLAAANVDAIASGTWLNVRAFHPDKFFEKDPDEKSRKVTWYYCPKSLSEYRMNFLDVAHEQGVLSALRPHPPIPRIHSDPLFSGAQPSSVDWRESASFRHYLDCLRSQAAAARHNTFAATMSAQHSMLADARTLIRRLHSHGVRGQDRDFADYIDVNESALTIHERARGSMLRRRW
jgi:hypothetical protein